jgi:hypothetical protein
MLVSFLELPSTYILCGYETWSVTLRGENKLMAFKKKVLRSELESKKPETEEEFHNV